MDKLKIYYTTDLSDYSKPLTSLITSALDKVEKQKKIKVEILKQDQNSIDSKANITSISLIQESALVISHIGSESSNIMYEIGVAHALGKPNVLVLNDELSMPFDIANFRYLTYNGKTQGDVLINKIAEIVSEIIDTPDSWILKPKIETDKIVKTVFVSYSHKDSSYLERLKIHLKALERNSSIQLWSDTLIQGGDKWKKEIENALNRSAVAVLLISADFLASDFIINSELQPLLKNAEEKGTTIIPIIVKPCRFIREPSINQFQSMNDPQNPLCKLSDHEQEDIYEKVSHRIEVILKSE